MTEQRTNREYLQADMDAIYIGNLNTVDADLILPARGEHGTLFTWQTGESRFIDADGRVHRPLHGMGSRKVTLTVTGEREGLRAERVFEATVLQEARSTAVRSVRPVEITGEPGMIPDLPSVVIVTCEDGWVTTLPVRWEVTPTIPDEGEMRVFGSLTESRVRPVAVIRPCEQPVPEAGPEKKLSYLPVSSVRLTPGSPYYEAQERMNAWLLSASDDQMLYNFRKAAGLSVKGAPPMTGWDEDACKLKGHTTGHYLSGLALAYAATGDVRFREKIDYMVNALAECQEAFAAGGKVHDGFLSAYDEEQFDLLEKLTRYPEIWAPYYTLDKIMSGLYDCHTLAGNAQALAIESKMGDWVYARLSRLPKKQLSDMWSLYIAGEFGGMFGTMVRLAQLTGKAEHLRAAELFYNEKLFYPMEQGVDTLEDMHGNQHIPQIIGAMDYYGATGEAAFWRIGSHFWEIVTGHHIYCVGGVGETEMFHAPDSTCRYLTDKAAESCASYNLLRLGGQLFPYCPDGRIMDYCENTLLNHILTSASREADGGTTYFLPLGPGGRKEYSTAENTCCHGTGMESRYRYMENIYAEDDEYLYVNLPVPSRLSGENALELAAGEDGVLTLTAQADQKKRLRVHIPAWAQDDVEVRLRGEKLAAGAAVLQNGYLELPERLCAGDAVEIRLPMTLRVLDNASDPDMVNLAFGPYILAELSEEQQFRKAPDVKQLQRKSGLTFTAGGRKMIPLARVDREAYHVYFRR